MNHGMTASFISEIVPNSCLPGLLTLCDEKGEGIKIAYPDTNLIVINFHAFTGTALKNPDFLR